MLISYHLFQPMRIQEMVTKLNLFPQLSILHQEFTHLSIERYTSDYESVLGYIYPNAESGNNLLVVKK